MAETMDTMAAGRELDALVAERLFGLRFERAPEGSFAGDLYGFSPLFVDDVMHFAPERYSTDIAPAWDVVEAMAARGWTFTLIWDTLCEKRNAEAWFEHPISTAKASAIRTEAPAAICLAALRALEAS